jgi:hypothetical protein
LHGIGTQLACKTKADAFYDLMGVQSGFNPEDYDAFSRVIMLTSSLFQIALLLPFPPFFLKHEK